MDLMHLLEGNQLLTGGAVLLVIGYIGATLRYIPGKIYNWLLKVCITKIEIRDTDDSYGWVRLWLSKNLKDIVTITVFTKSQLQIWKMATKSQQNLKKSVEPRYISLLQLAHIL